uniref:protein-serine/threonine phosphatase n=1 Tax=Callorhinchus milii TaxID=7868 RepID=A0A4W3INA6_CALMI
MVFSTSVSGTVHVLISICARLRGKQYKCLSISESFLTVKGAALFLPRGNGSPTPRINHRRNKHAGDLQQHLQAMFTLLRPEDNIRLAVRLESSCTQCTRYMVVVSTNGRQDTEESIVLGMDFLSKDSSTCTMGLVLPLWSDTLIHLDGDGGFSVSTVNRIHIFKPVSVQAMWSALQSLHKACDIARTYNYYPGSLYLTWISYYESRINSHQIFINEWNAMQDLQSHRSDSPVLFSDVPTECDRTERLIKTKLREIMMQKDLENITSKEIRTELEMQMGCTLREFKEFMDNEMIVILGQMDSPTEIFEHVYLGSEWNACNLEELQNQGVRYILNVTREIDNFFPGMFEYHNIRVYDEEATDLLAYWNDTYKFISKAKKDGCKCLVHCKMGISRSASTVIAYAMKEYGWNLDRAYSYVKEKRGVTKPNPSFMKQLEEYQGILLASKQRHNKLWRSHSDGDLSGPHERINKSMVDFNRRDSISSAEPSTDLLDAQFYHPQTSDLNTVLPGLHEEQVKFNPVAKCNSADDCSDRSWATKRMGTATDTDSISKICAGCSSEAYSFPIHNCQAEKRTEALPHHELASPRTHITALPDLETNSLENDPVSSVTDCILLPLLETESQPDDHIASQEMASPLSPSNEHLEASCSSPDRIDFFSAREKFIELSQEGRSRAHLNSKTEELGEGRCCATKGADEEQQQPGDDQAVVSEESVAQAAELTDRGNSEETNKENLLAKTLTKKYSLTRSQSLNVISVKEIVTEIESINQASGLCQSKTESIPPNPPKRNTIHELTTELHWFSENANAANKSGAERYSTAENNCEKVRDLIEPEPDEHSPVSIAVTNSEEPHEELAQDATINHNQVAKWCPGSVKRATKEFEQRLKQEQEQNSCVVTLPIRKSSRIDGVTSTESVVKDKSEDDSLESTSTFKDEENESTVEGIFLSTEHNMPLSDELTMDTLEHELQPRQKMAQAESELVERRTIHSYETSEQLSSQMQLPKRIEIIEYIHAVKQLASQEDNDTFGLSGESVKEKSSANRKDTVAHSADDQEIKTEVRPAQTSRLLELLPLDVPTLTQKCKGEMNEVTFTLGSPSEEEDDSSANDEMTAFITHISHSPSIGSEHVYQSHIVHLEGVTELSTDTDAEIPGDKLIHSENELQETETSEMSLQRTGTRCIAYLSHEDLQLSFDRFDESIRESFNRFEESFQEMQEASDSSSLAPNLSHISNNNGISKLSSTPGMVKQRAKEIEARIRQAGLTTPSQMKRSASIAKLGCLELSMDDVSKRDSDSSETWRTFFDSYDNTSWSVQSPHELRDKCSEEDEPSKKLCVVSICVPQQELQATRCFMEQLKTSENIVQSKPVEKPTIQYAKTFESTQPSPLESAEENLPPINSPSPSELDSCSHTSLMAIAPRVQHGRTHPLRRLKMTNERKRTSNPLYNTM